MKKAVAYCRVSTEEQTKPGHYSIETQEEQCIKNADFLGYEIIKTFKDEGKSGKLRNRPALNSLFEMIEREKVDAVFVLHTDRLARNARFHMDIKEDLVEIGIKLISVFEGEILNTADGILTDNVKAVINQHYSDLISEKTKQGLEKKADKGWLPTSAPVGYINTQDKNEMRIIVPDKEKAPFVKRAYELYITGQAGAENINDILYKEGFRGRTGKKLALSKFYVMLENPIYCGEFRWAGKVWPGNHEPIISKSLWDLAQRIRQTRTIRKNYERKHKFLLSSFIFCKCGRRFTAEYHRKPSSREYSYYHCTRGRKCADSRNIPLKDLEKQVQERFKEVQFSDEFFNRLLEKLKGRYDNYKQEVDGQAKGLKRLKFEVEKKRDKAEELLFNETIAEEVYKRQAEKFNKEINIIEEKLLKFQHQQNLQLGKFEEIIDFSRNVYKTYKKSDFDIKRMYLNFFWDRFIVIDRRIVEARPTPLFQALQLIQNQMQTTSVAINITQKTPIMEPSMVSLQRGGHSNNTAPLFEQGIINPANLGG